MQKEPTIDLRCGRPAMAGGLCLLMSVLTAAQDRSVRGTSAPNSRDTRDPEATMFGMSVAVLGDIDGDGEDEIAVGAPVAWSEACRPGAVLILGAKSHRLQRILWGPKDAAWFGEKVHALWVDPAMKYALLGVDRFGVYDPQTGDLQLALPVAIQGLQNDIDGDGLKEVVADHTHSSRTGEALKATPSAELRLVTIDANDDGFWDMLRPAKEGDKEIVLVSGIDGSELRRMPLPEPFQDCADEFAAIAADVDKDGRRDVVLTLPDINANTTKLMVFSGRSLNRRRAIPVQTSIRLPERDGSWFSDPDVSRRELHACGDLNEDGCEDVLAAGNDFFDEWLTCYSGIDGAVLWRFRRSVDELPSSVAGTRDLDGDGIMEIVSGRVMYVNGFGPPTYGTDGRVDVISGKSGRLLDRIEEREFPQISLERHLQTRTR